MPPDNEPAEKEINVSAPLPKDGKSLPGNIYSSAKELVQNPGKVFDAAAKVVTGKNSYTNDHIQSAYKLLQPGQIAGESAMTALQPGDSQVHVKGNAVLHIDTDFHLFIEGTQTETTLREAHFAYNHTVSTAVQGDDQQLNYGRKDLFVIGEATDQYVAAHETTSPETFEWKQFDRGFSATKLEGALVETSVTGAKFEFTGLDYSLKGIEAGPEADLLSQLRKGGKIKWTKWGEEAAEKAEEAAKEAEAEAEALAKEAETAAQEAAAEASAAAEEAAAEAPGLLAEAGESILGAGEAAVTVVEAASAAEIVEGVVVVALLPVGL